MLKCISHSLEYFVMTLTVVVSWELGSPTRPTSLTRRLLKGVVISIDCGSFHFHICYCQSSTSGCGFWKAIKFLYWVAVLAVTSTEGFPTSIFNRHTGAACGKNLGEKKFNFKMYSAPPAANSMLGNAQFNSTPFCPELFPASFVPSIPQRWTIAKGLQEWFNWGNGVVTLKLFGCFVRSFGRPISFLFHFFSLYCNPISICAAIIISWFIPYFIFDLSTGTLFSSRCFLQHVCRSWQIMAYFPLSLATAEQTSSTIVIVISIIVNIIISVIGPIFYSMS